MIDALPLVGGAAGGGLVGALVGYAAKKAVKVAALVVGIELALLAALENQGLISVNWEAINSALGGLANASANAGEMATSVAPSVLDVAAGGTAIGGGFALGALVGFKKG